MDYQNQNQAADKGPSPAQAQYRGPSHAAAKAYSASDARTGQGTFPVLESIDGFEEARRVGYQLVGGMPATPEFLKLVGRVLLNFVRRCERAEELNTKQKATTKFWYEASCSNQAKLWSLQEQLREALVGQKAERERGDQLRTLVTALTNTRLERPIYVLDNSLPRDVVSREQHVKEVSGLRIRIERQARTLRGFQKLVEDFKAGEARLYRENV